MVAALCWLVLAYLFAFPLVCAVILAAVWLYNLFH